MQDSAIPTKFPIPWGNSAGASFIRPIPTASQIGIQNGAASLTDGFPPNTTVPIAAGGSWPYCQDFNGILNQITEWLQWAQAGGPIYYDSAFSTAIGGYPKGATLASSVTNGNFWISTVDNNPSDPDTGGANWLSFVSGAGGTTPYDVQGGALGAITTNEVVLQFVATRATTFPSALAGSQGFLGTAATATTTFTVKKNGSTVGTMVFAASSAVATFTASVPVAMAAGDVLTVIAPSSADATAATLSFTLLGSV